MFTNTTDSVALNATSPPPSNVLKDKFNELHGRPITDEFVQSAAKEVLLTQEEVSIWLDHLNTILRNRKRGAAKAAATRQAKKAKNSHLSSENTTSTPNSGSVPSSSESCFCGTCGKEYRDETDDVEVWIGCDMCEEWYCISCEGLIYPPESDIYICTKCR